MPDEPMPDEPMPAGAMSSSMDPAVGILRTFDGSDRGAAGGSALSGGAPIGSAVGMSL